MTVTVAAIPVEKQHAPPAAPSSPATLASNAATVGLAVREYENPRSCVHVWCLTDMERKSSREGG